MNSKNSNQSGFSALETLLVIVIVVILGTVGWFVYNANKTANNNLTSSTSKQPTFKKITKKTTPSTTTSSTASTISNQNVIKIAALGVQVTVPDSIKDLVVSNTYTGNYNGSTVTSVNISTKTVGGLIPDCAAGDPNSTTGFGVLDKTAGQYPASGVSLTSWHKQFSTFYIDFSPRNGPCYPDSASASSKSIVDSQQTVFQAALPSVVLIP